MDTKKVVLITGGSRGLGRDMAISLAKKGLNIVITYHANTQAAQETQKQIAEVGGQSIALQLGIPPILIIWSITPGSDTMGW